MASEQEHGTANRFGAPDVPAKQPAPRKAAPVKAEPRPKAASASDTLLMAPYYIDNVVRGVSMNNGEYVLHWVAGGKEYTAQVPSDWVKRDTPGNTVMN